MKSKKILAGILSTSAIGVLVPSIASCNNKPSATPSVELSTSTPKEVEVGKGTTQVDYIFIQKNVSKPNNTKLEIVNLKADDVSQDPVDGLLTYELDTDNNILGNFNLSLAKTKYSASKFNFDIKITNQDAGLDLTITGFQITVSSVTFNISYPIAADIQGLTWDVKPGEIGYHDNLEIKFHLTKGYEFVADATELDVLINDVSVKNFGGVTFDVTSDPYSANGCVIYVPAQYTDNSVTIKLKTKAKTYHVTKSVGSNFYCAPITEITHGTQKLDIEFHPNNYYETSAWDVTMDGQSIKDAGASLITKESKQYLQIDTSKIIADINISATAKAKSYDIKLDSSAQHMSFTASKGTCEKNFEGTITLDAGYELASSQLSATCTDDVTKATTTFPVGVNDKGQFTIDKSNIHGPIVLNGTTQGKTFTVTYSITSDDHIKYDTTKTQVTYPDDFITTIEPENKYYTFSSVKDTWDVQANGVSLKDKAAFSGTTLTVTGSAITGNLTITAKASPATWAISDDYSGCSYMTGISSSKTLTYNTEYTAVLDIQAWATSLYTYSATATCHDPVKGDITIPANKITIDTPAKKLTIPAEYVTGPIDIKFAEAGNKYRVDMKEGSHFTYETEKIGEGKASFGTDYTIKIEPDDYYEIKTSQVQVFDDEERKISSSYNKTSCILTISGNNIRSNLRIEVTPTEMTYTAEVGTKDTGLTLKTDASQGSTAKYGTDYAFRYELDTGYELKQDSIECAVEGTADPLTIGNGLILDKENQTITVPGAKVTGNLTLTGKGQLITYQLINDATGIKSLTGTPTYKEELEIGVTMEDGYALNGADFADDSVKVMVGESTLTYQYDFSVSDGKITILANRITNNVKITGTVKSHTVTAKAKTGSEAAFASFTDAIAKEGTALTAHATLAEGYANPTVVAKCGDTEIPTSITVTGTDVAVQIVGSDITGPISLEYDATESEIKFDESAQTKLAIGDTSDVISALVTPGGQEPSISKISGPYDTSWNYLTKKLSAKDTEGTVVLQASYQGCAPVTHSIELIKPIIKITGSSSVIATNTVDLDYEFTNITPKSGTSSIVWHSSNETVATVDNWGVVTGLSAGTTKITVDIKYGSLTNAITSQEFTLTVETNKSITFNTDDLTAKNIVVDGMSGGVKLSSPSLTFRTKLDDTETTPKTGYFTFTNTALEISVNSDYVGVGNGWGDSTTVDFSGEFEKLTGDSAELTVTWTEVTGAQILVGLGWDTTLLSSQPSFDTKFIFDVEGYKTVKNLTFTTQWAAGEEKIIYIGGGYSDFTWKLTSYQEFKLSGETEYTISINIDISTLQGEKYCYLGCTTTKPS